MSDNKIVHIDKIEQINRILYQFDPVFMPSLTQRVDDLDTYAEKLFKYAIVLAAAEENDYIGVAVLYANDLENQLAYLSLISVIQSAQNRGVGKLLLDACIYKAKNNGMTALKLEVMNSNITAINFYKKNGFIYYGKASDNSIYMIKNLL